MAEQEKPTGTTPTGSSPTGATARMNSGDPVSPNTAAKVQQGGITQNPAAKVPSDLYPDPQGVTDETKGGPDD